MATMPRLHQLFKGFHPVVKHLARCCLTLSLLGLIFFLGSLQIIKICVLIAVSSCSSSVPIISHDLQGKTKYHVKFSRCHNFCLIFEG